METSQYHIFSIYNISIFSFPIKNKNYLNFICIHYIFCGVVQYSKQEFFFLHNIANYALIRTSHSFILYSLTNVLALF